MPSQQSVLLLLLLLFILETRKSYFVEHSLIGIPC